MKTRRHHDFMGNAIDLIVEEVVDSVMTYMLQEGMCGANLESMNTEEVRLLIGTADHGTTRHLLRRAGIEPLDRESNGLNLWPKRLVEWKARNGTFERLESVRVKNSSRRQECGAEREKVREGYRQLGIPEEKIWQFTKAR